MANLPLPNQKIGRNDPCHCGSGKKYKKCCLANDERNTSQNLADGYYQGMQDEEDLTDSQVATRKALDWALEKYEDAVMNAVAHFLTGLELEEAKKIFPENEDEQFLSQLFNEYALVDYEDENLGATLLTLYLKENAEKLNKEEKVHISVKLNTYKTLYEVQKIIRGRGMFLMDYFNGEKFWVRENKGTFSIKKWDIIFARVETYPDGIKKLTGCLVGFPREASGLNDLRRQYQEEQKLFGDDNDLWLFNFRHLMTPLIFQNIIEYYSNFAGNLIKRLINKDGDKLMFCKKIADIADYKKLIFYFDNNTLLKLTYNDGKEEVYNWLDDNNSIIASFYLKNKKLTIETNSEKRMKTIEDKFMADLQPWTKNWRAEFNNPKDLLQEKGGGNGQDREFTVDTQYIPGSVKPLSKKEEKKLMAKQMKKYYDDWLDMKLPALSGLTPREAAQDQKKRGQLIELLKIMENKDSHSKNIVGFDLKRIKRKLDVKF